jgi:drug/metabolite transporter (DMT)-like permease
MPHELMIATVAGLGGMFGWGFSEFAAKKSVDTIGTISSLVWAHVFGTIILCFLLASKVFLAGASVIFPGQAIEWIGLLFFGALQATVYYFAYKGFGAGEVSILSPIFASFAGLVALFSVLILGETLHVVFIPALIIIFVGVILVNLDIKNLQTMRVRLHAVPGLKEIIIATILATGWTLGWDAFTGSKDWMVYTTFMFVFMTFTAFVIAKFSKINLLQVRPAAWKYLCLIAIGEVVGYLAITSGYASTTYTSIVAILSGASSLPTIILARIFLKEKMTTIQMISSFIIIGGIVLLSIS